MLKLDINGKIHQVEVEPDTPLLWVLRDVLEMTGTKFGCGMALCGACTVHVDGSATRSCVLPVSAVAGKKITTIEGVSITRTGNAVQQAWMAHDVPQCGYCQSGQIMTATALLSTNTAPTDADIDNAMSGNICRCGHHLARLEVAALRHVELLPRGLHGLALARGEALDGRDLRALFQRR